MEWEGTCKARKVGFFLIDVVGGGDATAKSSSRLASVEFMFSLSSMSMESET